MQKRFLSLALTLCLLIGLLPAVAVPHAQAAVESMSVTLFGATTTVNAGETLYWADDGTNIPAAVTADDDWNYSLAIVDDIPVVTLRNANYRYAKSFLYKKFDGSLKVKYEGINNVCVPLDRTSKTYRYFVSFASATNSPGKGHLYILGGENAVLNVTGGDDNNSIIEVQNKAYLTFSGGTLNIEKTNAYGVLSLIGAAYAKTTIENCNLTVKDNTNVSNKRPAVTLGHDTYGLTIRNSNVVIENNGNIGLCLGYFQTNMAGVLNPAPLTITGNSDIKVVNNSLSASYSYSGAGIYAQNITVEGGSLEVEGKKQAIYTTSGKAPILSSYAGGYHMFTAKNGDPVDAYTATTYFKVIPSTVCLHKQTVTTEEVTQAATCGKEGAKNVIVTCADCGEFISESVATIPATNAHSYDPVTGICSVCGDVDIPLVGPTWPEDVTFATAAQMANVVVEKKASAGGAVTAHPGGRITYKLLITNNNAEAINVHIEDAIPRGARLVSGCDYTSGRALYWVEKDIAPGETRVITYNVAPDYTINEIRASETDIILTNTDAKVMDVTVPAPVKDIWVLPTFNETDRYRMEMGIKALVNANLSAKNSGNNAYNRIYLIAAMYQVGFSASTAFGSGNPDELFVNAFEKGTFKTVVPTLYGGTKVPASADSYMRGDRATSVTTADLITGDVIVVQRDGETKLYIYDGTYLVETGETAVTTNIDPIPVLQALPFSDKYFVCRQSFVIATAFSLESNEYYNDYDKQEYTELEKALVATAKAYLLRGDRTQYDDGSINPVQGRFEVLVRNPEDYTVDQYGYLDCSHFTYDLHWATYGYAAKATNTSGSTVDYGTCKNMLDCIERGWNSTTLTGSNKSAIYYYKPTGNETDAEKEAIYQTFISRLRPGDIITYRYAGETGGHAMLYIGRGLLIHCTGSMYSKTNKQDTHEAAIRFMGVDELFDKSVNANRYLFDHSRFGIVRPQNLTTPKITENTANRVANLQGIVAEKVSSTAMGKTVNPGDEITYTFYVFNTNEEDKTIAIRDVLSEYVSFVSATNGGTVSGNEINWNFTVPAGVRTAVSYTVKVNKGVAAYTAIDGSKATVNGVAHKCIDSYVANTLNAEQQQTLIDAINAVKNMDRTGLNAVQIAELIYKEAFGVEHIFGGQVTNERELVCGDTDKNYSTKGKDNMGVFNDTWYYESSYTTMVSLMDINTSAPAMMVAPGLYGGTLVYNSSYYSKNYGRDEKYTRYLSVNDTSLRSRLFWEKDLVVGDILMLGGSSSVYLYIYVGDNTMLYLSDFSARSAQERLQYAPHSDWKYVAVLRPSMVMETVCQHTEEIIPGKDATCTETGLTEGKKCTACGELLVEQTEIAALGHTAVTTVEAVNATCTEAGSKKTTVTCEVCGEVISKTTEKIPAPGHSYANDAANECSVCGAVRANITVVDDEVFLHANGMTGVKVHVFNITDKEVADIDVWNNLRAADPAFKSYTKFPRKLAKGTYVLRIQYNDADGVKQADSHQVTIDYTPATTTAPQATVRGKTVSIDQQGTNVRKVHVFYVDGKEIADTNDWYALKAADPMFRSYTKTQLTVKNSGAYVVRIEYVDENGDDQKISRMITVQ